MNPPLKKNRFIKKSAKTILAAAMLFAFAVFVFFAAVAAVAVVVVSVAAIVSEGV